MIKDILLHLDPAAAGARRAALACELAARFDAHLTGLHVDAVDEEVLFYYGEMVSTAIEALREQALRDNRRAQEIFFRATEGADFSYEWRCVKGQVAATVAAQAHCADLVILGQGVSTAARGIADRAPLLTGRPVLLVPNEPVLTAPLGQRIVIAWDGGREAARAVHDALPLLRQAQEVLILTVSRDRGEGPLPSRGASPADLATHLDRHGIRAQVAERERQGRAVSGVIAALVAETGANLLVMGLYGHSRVSELILGGVTRDIVNATQVPVFGSH